MHSIPLNTSLFFKDIFCDGSGVFPFDGHPLLRFFLYIVDWYSLYLIKHFTCLGTDDWFRIQINNKELNVLLSVVHLTREFGHILWYDLMPWLRYACISCTYEFVCWDLRAWYCTLQACQVGTERFIIYKNSFSPFHCSWSRMFTCNSIWILFAFITVIPVVDSIHSEWSLFYYIPFWNDFVHIFSLLLDMSRFHLHVCIIL